MASGVSRLLRVDPHEPSRRDRWPAPWRAEPVCPAVAVASSSPRPGARSTRPQVDLRGVDLDEAHLLAAAQYDRVAVGRVVDPVNRGRGGSRDGSKRVCTRPRFGRCETLGLAEDGACPHTAVVPSLLRLSRDAEFLVGGDGSVRRTPCVRSTLQVIGGCSTADGVPHLFSWIEGGGIGYRVVESHRVDG